jgi:disulfide bond formation protein DsbB
MAWRSKYKTIKATAPVWLLWGAGAALVMLAIAHGFQTFGHLNPCELCLHQREGYWAAAGEGAVGYGLARWRPAQLGRVLLILLAVIFAGEMVLAAYHAGVEWKWWPGPPACSGSGGRVSAAQMSSLLSGAKVRFVSCEDAAWRFLGLSMAGWNALIALALTLATAVAVRRVKLPR